GSSQATWPPISAPNSRVRPVAPQPFIPPTLPVSSPVSRPNPLYPKVGSRMLLCWEPPMYGRDAAGHSATVATHQPAATTVAKVVPASRPAAVPNQRRTVAYSSPTAATPASASGTRMLQALRPNSRTDKPISHSAAGVLSTVIALPASSEPKNHAFQLTEPACAAAA